MDDSPKNTPTNHTPDTKPQDTNPKEDFSHITPNEHHSQEPRDTQPQSPRSRNKRFIISVLSLLAIAIIATAVVVFALPKTNKGADTVNQALENLLQQNISEYEFSIQTHDSGEIVAITYNGKNNKETKQHQGLLTIEIEQNKIPINVFSTPDAIYVRMPQEATDILFGAATPLQNALQEKSIQSADQWIRIDLDNLNLDELIEIIPGIFPEIRATIENFMGGETGISEQEWQQLEEQINVAIRTMVIPEITAFKQQWQQQREQQDNTQLNILSIDKNTYSQYDTIESAKKTGTKTVHGRELTTYDVTINHKQASRFIESITQPLLDNPESRTLLAPLGITNEEINEITIDLPYTLTVGIDERQNLLYFVELQTQSSEDSQGTTVTINIKNLNTNPTLQEEPEVSQTWVQAFKDVLILIATLGLQGAPIDSQATNPVP